MAAASGELMPGPWEQYQQQPAAGPWDQYRFPEAVWDAEQQRLVPSSQGRPPDFYRDGQPMWIDPDPGAAGYAMTRQEPRIPPRSLLETTNDIAGYIDLGARGATLGLWPHLRAAVAGGVPGIFSEEGFGGGYRNALEEINANMERVQGHSPTIAAVTEMGGAMLPALVTGGTTLAANAPVAATSAGRVANALRSVGAGATMGGAGAATYGFLEGTGDVGERVANAYQYAGPGAVVGGALPAAFAISPVALRTARALLPQGQQARISGASGARYSEQNIVDAANSWRAQTRELYAELEASGIRFPRSTMDDSLLDFMEKAEEGLSQAPAVSTYVDDLVSRSARYGELQSGIPVGTLERWRQEINQKINDAWGQSRGEEARMFERLRDHLDDQIIGTLGDDAREAFLNTIRIDALQEAATRAADRAGRRNIPYEEALQAQLQRIKDGRLWDRFSPEQKDAITAAIRDPGPLAGVESLFNFIFGRGIRRIATNAIGTVGAVATQNPALALPAISDAAARASRAITQQGNLNRVADRVLPGGVATAQPGIPIEVLRTVNALSRATIPAVATNYATGGGF